MEDTMTLEQRIADALAPELSERRSSVLLRRLRAAGIEVVDVRDDATIERMARAMDQLEDVPQDVMAELLESGNINFHRLRAALAAAGEAP